MQPELDIDDRLQAVEPLAQVRDGAGLVDRQPPGAGEMDEEEIVLLQIVPEGLGRQRAGAELPHEVVLAIGPPVIGAGRLEPLEGGEVGGGHVATRSRVLEVPSNAGGPLDSCKPW